VVEATGKFECRCQVVENKIAFCQLHAQAESLFSACEYLRKVISTVKLATLDEENLIREIVLPYADDVIKRASRPIKE